MKLFAWILLTIALACDGNEASEPVTAKTTASYETVLDSKNDFVQIEQRELKIIKTAHLKFETKNIEETYSNIARFVKENNGYIQNDNSTNNTYRTERSLVIKIPNQYFQKTIDSISKGVRYFDAKNISADDVTEEFVDLEARLKAKRTLEKRYLELLDKAKNVKEVLEIEKELSKIREEIEAKQGRLNYLQNQVAFSTISLSFYILTEQKPNATASYGTKMWNAIKSGANGVSLVFLGLLHIWPLLLFTAILIIVIKKRLLNKPKN